MASYEKGTLAALNYQFKQAFGFLLVSGVCAYFFTEITKRKARRKTTAASISFDLRK